MCETGTGQQVAQLHERLMMMMMYIPVVFKLLVWCGAEGYVSGLQDAGLLVLFYGVCGVGD